jgi:hypothetical protein
MNDDKRYEYKYYEFQLDSNDCENSFSNSVDKKNWPAFLLDKNLDNVSGFKVLEVSIPNTFPTFRNGVPNITLTEVGRVFNSDFSTKINYSETSFAATLQEYLNEPSFWSAAGTFVYTVTWNSSRFRIQNNDPGVGSGFTMDFTNCEIMGFNNTTTYTTDVLGPNPYLENQDTVTKFNPLFFYVNSISFGSLVDVLLPSNGILSSDTNSSLGPQLTKVGNTATSSGQIINWQDPCPDKWFNTSSLNLSGKMDFYITASDDIDVPLNFIGRGFSLKIGLMRKIDSVTEYLHGNSLISKNNSRFNIQGMEDLNRSVMESLAKNDPDGYNEFIKQQQVVAPPEEPQELISLPSLTKPEMLGKGVAKQTGNLRSYTTFNNRGLISNRLSRYNGF